MSAPRVREALSLALMFAIAACGGGGGEPTGTTPPANTPASVTVVSGNGQSGLVGTQLSLPLVVKVATSAGAPVTGASVAFAVTSGAGSVSPASTTTDATGQAKTTVTLGSTAGNVTITATVAGTALTTSFVVTAGATTVSTACSTGSPQSLALGEVRPSVSGTGLCLAGGADYALIAFNSNPDSTLTQATVTVRSQNAVAVTTADQAPAFNAVPGMSAAQPSALNLQRAFDLHLRETARRELTPLIPAARQAYRSHAAFNAIPSTVNIGDILTLNANGNQACTNPINVKARVAAITTNAIIVSDTANPTGGFTDAEYASFGTTFDTLVNPLDVQAFGQPSDIDNNHKIVILFTKEVNKLTPRGSFGFIGGFFFERDLFPTANTPQLQGCAGSNVGEMFYLLVPDPNAVFSDKRTKTDVLNNTIGTLAHEYQHLINASRRLFVNNANDFETVWLNEGLSHIAEELAYYRVTNTGPRQNIGITVIGQDSVSVNRFNEYEADNFGRYQVFIGKPNQTGVYAVNDSLETRGATWSMLRYLADHRGSSDGDTWQQLVNSTSAGLTNISNVFGPNYMTQIRDWATSVFTDDLSGVADARFQQPSWKFREIFPRLSGSGGKPLGVYPLAVVPLSDAAPANVNIVAGGTAYLRFSVTTGSQGSIDWTSAGLPVSPFIQFTVVRTR